MQDNASSAPQQQQDASAIQYRKSLTPLYVIGFLGLMVIIGAVLFVINRQQVQTTSTVTITPTQEVTGGCTKDLRICPDGTKVGRIMPNCEFPACSVATKTDITSGWNIYANSMYDFQFRYPKNLIKNHTPTGAGVSDSFTLDQNIKVIVRDPPLEEDFFTRNYNPHTFTQINGIKSLKHSSNSSSIGGNPPYLKIVQYIFFLPKANVIFSFNENQEGEYDKFAEDYELILQSFAPLAQDQSEYTCPENGWINCMPILTEDAKKACTNEAILWYRSNCPNFQGVSQ